MKPTLNRSLLMLVLAVSGISWACADYNGGQLLDMDDTYTGEIVINYTNDDTENPAGAVQRTQAGETSLEGNIVINTGNGSGEQQTHAVYIHDDVENAVINVKATGSDRIVITTENGEAFRNISESSTINVESDSPIELNIANAGAIGTRGTVNVKGDLVVTGTDSAGIVANRPDDNTRGASVTVDGSFHATMNGIATALSVLNANGADSSIRMQDAVTMDVTHDASGATYGLLTMNGGEIDVKGPMSIHTRGSGIIHAIVGFQANIVANDSVDIVIGNSASSFGVRSSAGGRVTLNGATSIQYVNGYGMFADGGDLVANGRVSISSTASTRAVVSVNGGNVLLSGGNINASKGLAFLGNCDKESIEGIAVSRIANVGGAAFNYTIDGSMHVRNHAIIDLKLGYGSRFTGKTSFYESGIGERAINLDFSGQSLWTVTGDSTLTNLTLDDTSWLAFSLLDGNSMTFANINAASIALADGAVLQLLGVKSTDFETTGRALTTFTASLINADTLSADGVKLVTGDNYELVYTNNGDGTFTVTGVTGNQLFIPEPASTALSVIGLAVLMLRRRKA